MPRLTVITTLLLTACGGPPASRATSLSFDARGRVYVVDSLDPFVRVFETDLRRGEVVGTMTLGPKGQGPGEMMMPAYAFSRADNSIIVFDLGAARATIFEPDGEVRESFYYPQRISTSAAFDRANDTLYLAWRSNLARSPGPRLDRWKVGDEEPTDLPVAEDQLPEPRPLRPASHLPVAVVNAGEVAIGDGWDYRIRVVNGDGVVTREFGRDGVPRPSKPAEQLEQEEARMRRREKQPGLSYEEPDTELHHFPRSAFDTDEHGRFWVLTTRGSKTESILDVFAPSGEYLGELNVPADISLPSWRAGNGFDVEGGYLASLTLDQDHLERITIWRIIED